MMERPFHERQPPTSNRTARVAGGRHLDPEAVGVKKERRVVVGAVLRPQPRRVEDVCPCLRSGSVRCVHVGARLDGERQVVRPGRVELELLILECLPKPERTGPPRREAQVVDVFPALALDEARGDSRPSGPKTAA